MAPVSFLVALSVLAIFSCTFGTTPANALAVDNNNVRRHIAHAGIAKRKNDLSKRCKPRSNSVSASSSWSASSSSYAPSPSSSSPPPKTSSSSTWTPPPSSSAPAPASTPTSSAKGGGINGGTKAGLAWALGNDQRLQMLARHFSVIYTWSPDMPTNTYNLTRAPMLWGWNQAADFKNVVVKGYANYALGPNEPNEVGQSNLSPSDGANLWKQYLEPLSSQGYQLGSPAMSSRPNGKQWMSDFFAACSGCHVDFLALHWYDVSFQSFQTYFEDWHNTYDMDIWITEYACQNFNGGAQPNAQQILDFYSKATTYINTTPWIKVAAAFGFMDQMQGVNPLDQLLNGNTITALGWVVIG